MLAMLLSAELTKAVFLRLCSGKSLHLVRGECSEPSILVVRRQQLISLLEDHFFPKWRAVLQHWLMHEPDYEEVTAWYLGWKVSCLFSQYTQTTAPSVRAMQPATPAGKFDALPFCH